MRILVPLAFLAVIYRHVKINETSYLIGLLFLHWFVVGFEKKK